MDKQILLDDKKRKKVKTLCVYIKSHPNLLKYKTLSDKEVSFMDEILLGGTSLRLVDETITVFEENLEKGGKHGGRKVAQVQG